MKRIILVIEDKISEVVMAKNAVAKAECIPVVADNLEDGFRLLNSLKDKIFGVVTDIHFPSRNGWTVDADKPNGLAVVARCVELGMRVSVCSDVDHHYSNYLDIPLKVLEGHQGYSFGRIPVSHNEKNWDLAVCELLKLTVV